MSRNNIYSHQFSHGSQPSGLRLLRQESGIGIFVATIEARVLLKAFRFKNLPGPHHNLSVTHGSRVLHQHRLHSIAKRSKRLPAGDGGCHVGGGLVGLTPAQQNAVVGAERVEEEVEVERGEAEPETGVGGEELEEVGGDVGGGDVGEGGEVVKDGGEGEGPRGEVVGVSEGRRADLFLLFVDEASAVAGVGENGETCSFWKTIH